MPDDGIAGHLADDEQSAGGLRVGKQEQIVFGYTRGGPYVRSHPIEVAPRPAGDKAIP